MKTIALLSEKGGVGRSLVAVALAAAMVRQGKKTVVADLDDCLHTLDLYTGMQDRAIIWQDDFFSGKASLDALLLQDETLGGFFLSPAPAQADCLTPENGRMFKERLEWESAIDVLLLDLPARSGEAFAFAEAVADVFLVLSDEGDVALLAAERMAERLRGKEGYLLLNRFDLLALLQKKQRNRVEEMIDRVRLPLIGIIPENEELRYAADGGMLQRLTGESVLPFDNLAYRLNGGRRLLFEGMKDGKRIRRSL